MSGGPPGTPTPIPVWRASSGAGRSAKEELTKAPLAEADLHVEILREAGDSVTVRVVDGQVPDDATEVLFVLGRGRFVVAARRFWCPAIHPDLLLTLVSQRTSEEASSGCSSCSR